MDDRPKKSKCQLCDGTFTVKMPKQGGTRRPTYCSSTCRSRAWEINNPERRNEVVKEYRKRDRRTLSTRVRKYGWTLADYDKQFARQRGRCAGCLVAIDESAHIDHDHETGKARGILCPRCNHALGHTRDDPSVLRRLMAYLERDVDTPLVYVGGSLRNPRIPEIGNLLRANGYDAMDEWFTPGEKADDNWQAYEALRGRTYREALLGRAATNIFLFDRSYLDLSDAFVAVAPYGKSAAIEMGYAAGGGIPTLLYTDGEDMGRYEIMPNTVDAVVHTEEELLYHLKKLLAPIWGTE